MYCHKCGAANDDNAWRCTQCATVLYHEPPPVHARMFTLAERVPTHLRFSIVVAIFFLPSPLGLVALYHSLRTKSHLEAGDEDKARASSRVAYIWCWVSLAAGLALSFAMLGYSVRHAMEFAHKFFPLLQIR